MTTQSIKIDPQELTRKLYLISETMQKGQIEGLYQLKELLQRYQYHRPEMMKQLTPRTRAVMRVLYEFVVENLWKNFGPDNTGFPKKKGEPLLTEICRRLSWFVRESVFQNFPDGIKSDPMEELSKALGAYTALLSCAVEAFTRGSEKDFCVL